MGMSGHGATRAVSKLRWQRSYAAPSCLVMRTSAAALLGLLGRTTQHCDTACRCATHVRQLMRDPLEAWRPLGRERRRIHMPMTARVNAAVHDARGLMTLVPSVGIARGERWRYCFHCLEEVCMAAKKLLRIPSTKLGMILDAATGRTPVGREPGAEAMAPALGNNPR